MDGARTRRETGAIYRLQVQDQDQESGNNLASRSVEVGAAMARADMSEFLVQYKCAAQIDLRARSTQVRAMDAPLAKGREDCRMACIIASALLDFGAETWRRKLPNSRIRKPRSLRKCHGLAKSRLLVDWT